MANEVDRKLRMLRAKQRKLWKELQKLTRDAGSNSPCRPTAGEIHWYVSWALYENQEVRDLLRELAQQLGEKDEDGTGQLPM